MTKIPFKFERVDWEDINASSEWTNRDELLRPQPASNFGFVVYEDESFICLTSSLPHDMKQFGDCISIPKGAIKKRVRIAHKALSLP